MDELRQLILDNPHFKVAVVGNATPEIDYSTFIDAHDIVIRQNHYYNLESGLVGKKIDAIIIANKTIFSKRKVDKRIVHTYYPTLLDPKTMFTHALTHPYNNNTYITTGVLSVMYFTAFMSPMNVNFFCYTIDDAKVDYTHPYHKSAFKFENDLLKEKMKAGYNFFF